MQYVNKKKRRYGRWIIVGLVMLILVAGGVYWWHRDHPTKTTASTTAYQKVTTNSGKATANPNVPGSTSTNSNPTTGSSASKNPQSTTKPAPDTSTQPQTPTGQFVSDHHPNLSGSPAPNTETSACTTTPGVKCEIKFTSGSVVKILPAQQTDSDGGTIWNNWTLQSIGLTAGTWNITAVAINGTKTASAQDALQLMVAK